MGRTTGSKTINSDVIEKMMDLRQKGLSNSEIATELNCARYTVYKYIGKQKSDVTEKMMDLRQKGLSNSKIAIELNRSRKTVYEHIGKQPSMTRANPGDICAYTHDKSFIAKEDPSEPYRKPESIKELGRTIEFESDLAQYTIDEVDNCVIILTKDSSSLLRLSYAEFQKFFFEIRYLNNRLTYISQNSQTI